MSRPSDRDSFKHILAKIVLETDDGRGVWVAAEPVAFAIVAMI